MEQHDDQQQQGEVLLKVAVQRPGQQQLVRRYAAGPGALTCSDVESKLQQEFGRGNLCRDEVVLLPTAQLQPGQLYVYNVFAGTSATPTPTQEDLVETFLAATRAVVYPGALISVFTSMGALGQLFKTHHKGSLISVIFRVLACMAQLAIITGAALVTWRLAGVAAAVTMVVGFSALSVADKSLEYLWYKGQAPLLGAAGLWLLIACGLGVVAVLQSFVCSVVLTLWCVVVAVVAAVCWCLEHANCAQGSHKKCADMLAVARQQLRMVWKLPVGRSRTVA